MIDLYTWKTPNGVKVSIMLEELALPYTVHPINIGKDEQFAPAFLKISPNNKIPAIVDHDTGQTVFESGAILIYLAEKTGSPLLPASGQARFETLEWLMFQMGGVGPMFGQFFHFTASAKEKIPYAIERYTNEAKRLLSVMEKRLGDVDYLAGEYSIADIATYSWTSTVYNKLKKTDADFTGSLSNISAWFERVGARPAVQKGMLVPKTAS